MDGYPFLIYSILKPSRLPLHCESLFLLNMTSKLKNYAFPPGIQTGLYTPPPSTFESADINPDNKCYYPGEKCPPRGLQNISPCQYSK